MRVPSLVGALVAPFLLIACATAALPSDLGNGNGDGDGGVVSGGDSGHGSDDGSTSGNDAGTGNDTGSTDPDTGSVADTGPVPDSAPPPARADDCVGPNSTQLMNLDGTPEAYDDACDAYFMNVGASNPCTASGTSCAAFNGTSGFTNFCCYHPPSGSPCAGDYGAALQCIPQ
jgi:hypothetical protein